MGATPERLTRRVPRLAQRDGGRAPAVQAIDGITVGLAIHRDTPVAALGEIERRLAAADARCLVVDLSDGRTAPPELAREVAGLVDRACRRGYSVAVVSPGAELLRAFAAGGRSRMVEVVATRDEALARVRGRLTPAPTLTVLPITPPAAAPAREHTVRWSRVASGLRRWQSALT